MILKVLVRAVGIEPVTRGLSIRDKAQAMLDIKVFLASMLQQPSLCLIGEELNHFRLIFVDS
jgi:hypothetical protein